MNKARRRQLADAVEGFRTRLAGVRAQQPQQQPPAQGENGAAGGDAAVAALRRCVRAGGNVFSHCVAGVEVATLRRALSAQPAEVKRLRAASQTAAIAEVAVTHWRPFSGVQLVPRTKFVFTTVGTIASGTTSWL